MLHVDARSKAGARRTNWQSAAGASDQTAGKGVRVRAGGGVRNKSAWERVEQPEHVFLILTRIAETLSGRSNGLVELVGSIWIIRTLVRCFVASPYSAGAPGYDSLLRSRIVRLGELGTTSKEVAHRFNCQPSKEQSWPVPNTRNPKRDSGANQREADRMKNRLFAPQGIRQVIDLPLAVADI